MNLNYVEYQIHLCNSVSVNLIILHLAFCHVFMYFVKIVSINYLKILRKYVMAKKVLAVAFASKLPM